MLRIRLPLAVALAASLAAATPARAWNRATHEAIAALAYEELALRDPAALRAALALLRAHPSYAEAWRAEIAAAGARSDDDDLHLFMLGARWADDVMDHRHRDYPDGGEPGHNAWHWMDHRWRADGRESRSPEPNLVTAFATSRDRLLSTTVAHRHRAEALAWALHLAADAHAPLHTMSFWSAEFADGDGGGNRSWVRVDGRPVRMHTLWDGLLLRSSSGFAESKALAARLRTLPAPSAEALAETRFEAWVEKESRPLAIEHAYLRGRLDVGLSPETAPELPAGYVAQATAVSERQAVLAARRTAALVSAWF
jgi:hypothetical protein